MVLPRDRGTPQEQVAGAKVAVYDQELPPDPRHEPQLSYRSPAVFPAVRQFTHDPFLMASTLTPGQPAAGPAPTSNDEGRPPSHPIVVATCVDVEVDRLDFSFSHRQFRMLRDFATFPAAPEVSGDGSGSAPGGSDETAAAERPEPSSQTPRTDKVGAVDTAAEPAQNSGGNQEGWLSWAWNTVVGDEEDADAGTESAADGARTPSRCAPRVL